MLDGDKVIAAIAGQSPIGVIRPKDASCIIGNNSWNHWKNKYIKNDFGEYQRQDIEYVEWEEDTFEEKVIQKTIKQVVKNTTLDRVGREFIEKEIDTEKIVPVFEEIPIFDKNKNPVMGVDYDGKSYQKTQSTPVMETKRIANGKKNILYKKSELGAIKPPLDAKTFTRSEKVLNSSYDGSLKYVPTEEREEKVLVGLLGQIPIKAGSALNSRWVKMKEINNNVHMYYVS